jgi:hypothetical protein
VGCANSVLHASPVVPGPRPGNTPRRAACAPHCAGRPVREALLESARVGRAEQSSSREDARSAPACVAARERDPARTTRLKKELASGRVRIEDVIAEPPEFARTAKVYDLLLALPTVGPAKAGALAHPVSNRAVKDGRRTDRSPAPRADRALPPLSAARATAGAFGSSVLVEGRAARALLAGSLWTTPWRTGKRVKLNAGCALGGRGVQRLGQLHVCVEQRAHGQCVCRNFGFVRSCLVGEAGQVVASRTCAWSRSRSSKLFPRPHGLARHRDRPTQAFVHGGSLSDLQSPDQ